MAKNAGKDAVSESLNTQSSVAETVAAADTALIVDVSVAITVSLGDA